MRVLLLRTVTVFAILACGGSSYTDITSSATRDATPSSTDVPTLTGDNARFAFDFYHAVAKDETSNLVFSPHSISVALAMEYAGTANETASQLASAMHFTLSPDRLATAFDSLDLSLASRQNVTLALANSIWAQRSETFVPAFLDTLAIDYGSEVRGVDFLNDAPQAVIAMNDWVSDQTNGKIVDLFSAQSIDASTRIVLVDAIYFDANWDAPFSPNATAPHTFTRLDASTVQADEMHVMESTTFAQTPAYTAIDIPYRGRALSMLVVMPADGQFTQVEASFDATVYADIVESLKSANVDLSLPKFTFQGSSTSLKSALVSLGVDDLFGDGADLSAMVSNDPLHVTDVLHEAYIRVNETGTEAAAATGVVNGDAGVSQPQNPQTIVIDHPFFFFIHDVPTREILFAGRVLDPTH